MGGKTKLKHLATYLEPEEKEALEKEAKKEGRTLSNLIAKILRDWMTKKG